MVRRAFLLFVSPFEVEEERTDTMDKSNTEALTERPPRVLFRYMDLEGAVKTLATRTNKFSPLNQLDDTREGLVGSIENGTPEEEHELLRQTMLALPSSRLFFNEQFKTHYSNEEWIAGLTSDTIDIDRMIKAGMTQVPDEILFQLQKELSDEYAICCFSEEPTNEVMWADYADKSFGVCFGFRIPAQRELQRVIYSETPVSLPNPFGPKGFAEYRKACKALCTKLKDWEYQKEWRVILHRSRLQHINNLLLAPFDCSLLDSIILGARNQTDQELFCLVFGSIFPSTKICRTVIKPSSPNLSIVDIPHPNRHPHNVDSGCLFRFQMEMFPFVLERLGFSREEIKKRLFQSIKLVKQRMENDSCGIGRAILQRCNTNESEKVIRTIAVIIENWSRWCAIAVEIPNRNSDEVQLYDNRSTLFFKQALEDVFSTFPSDPSGIPTNQLTSKLLAHVICFVAPVVELCPLLKQRIVSLTTSFTNEGFFT